MKVMFLGTSSSAGKTTLCAMYCRYLTRKGLDVSPFKASNLSLNSYVTKEGEEIGMGQAFCSWYFFSVLTLQTAPRSDDPASSAFTASNAVHMLWSMLL